MCIDTQLKFSIITPSFNQGRFIADAIESVASQKYSNLEHIIIDAQSTDETKNVVDGYSHLSHLKWISEPDDGQTDAINKGFKLASGDIVAWLNADDYYDELSSEPWYSVGENDIFPEEFRRFLIGNKTVRDLFFKFHDDIFDVKFWKEMQGIQERGEIIDVFPYRENRRFLNRYH